MSADHANRDPRAFTFDPAKVPDEERLDFAADNASDISRLVMDAEREGALGMPFGWDLTVYAFDDPEGAGIIVAVGLSRIDLDDEIPLVSAYFCWRCEPCGLVWPASEGRCAACGSPCPA